MQKKPNIAAVSFLIGLLLFPSLAPGLQVQTAPPPPAQAALPPPPTPQQLDQLLAPVALYPDSLLAQITTASTNPQEILDVDNWLAHIETSQGPRLPMPPSSRDSILHSSRSSTSRRSSR
jgi:hypothetical protein